MKEVIVDLKKINITYITSFIVAIIVGTLIIFIKGNPIFFKWKLIALLYFIAVITLHEAIHAIGFILFAKVSNNKVKFGFHKQYYVPYCSAEGIVTKYGYSAALLLPNVLLSTLGFISLLFTSNFFWVLFVAWVVASGSGDYYMFNLVSKYNKDIKFIDHPTEPGFFVVEDNTLY